MKDLRKFYYWCVFITILLFSLLQWYFHLNPTTIEEDNKLLLSKIREREIKTIIKRKSINNYKRRAIFIIYDKDSIPIDYEWEEKIQVGDSIIKPKGSLKLLIKRGGYLIDTLDYEDNNSIILPNNW
jgi:hypothetical protein